MHIHEIVRCVILGVSIHVTERFCHSLYSVFQKAVHKCQRYLLNLISDYNLTNWKPGVAMGEMDCFKFILYNIYAQ